MNALAKKLAWEIQALNDRGDYRPEEITSLEICYGIALCIGDQPDFFQTVMASIIEQVSDVELQRLLRLYTTRSFSK